MRIANWHQITDASWIQGNLLNADAAGSDGLKNVSETLTLVPYGSSSTSTTQLSRTNGTATIIAQNSSLLTESAVLGSAVERTARAVRPFLVALLAGAILLLGLASLPRVAVPDPRLNDVLARHRAEIATVGVVALVAVAVAFLLG